MRSLKTYYSIPRKKGFYTCLRELKIAVWPIWLTHSRAAIEQIQAERTSRYLWRKYGSLMSLNALRTFIWNNESPLNYNRAEEKWPRTQTLPVYYEVNSGVFIADLSTYINQHDRISSRVQMYETSKLESMDIDWPEDFEHAEMLYKMLSSKK